MKIKLSKDFMIFFAIYDFITFITFKPASTQDFNVKVINFKNLLLGASASAPARTAPPGYHARRAGR